MKWNTLILGLTVCVWPATTLPAIAQQAGHQMGTMPDASQTAVADCARAQAELLRTIDAANMRVETARQSNSPSTMRAAMDDLQGALGSLRAQLAACRDLAKMPDPRAGHAMPAMPQAPAASPGTPVMQPGSTAPAPAAPATKTPAADLHVGHTMPPAPTTKPPAPTTKPASTSRPKVDPHAGHKTPAPEKPKPPAKASDPHAGHTPAPGPDKEADPVNGLMVDPATAPKTTYQGRTYYFSSEQSLKEFLQNPAKFAKPPKK